MTKTVVVIYEDRGSTMVPKSEGGKLVDYGSIENAEDHRRMLAVPAYIEGADRIKALLDKWDLKGIISRGPSTGQQMILL